MDLKSLARSKRAHTQHHQPRKPRHLKPKAASASSSSPSQDPEVAKKEAKERKREPRDSSLPSNWDRFVDHEAEDEDGGGELLWSSLDSAVDQTATAKTDVVKPKSKGADFGFLISQAKSQPAAYSSVSLDDVLPDYCRGLGSMLSVRGENLVSWTGGDCFLAEDESTSSIEAPFLSLNLQTLAEELSQVDLAKRLFIDPDLLPPELRGTTMTKESSSLMPQGREQKDEAAIHTPSARHRERPVNLDDKFPISKDLRKTNEVSSPVIQEVISEESIRTVHATDISKRVPTFKATAAEAELDSLLNSFSEKNIVNDGPSSTISINLQGSSGETGNTSTMRFPGGKSAYSESQVLVLNPTGSSHHISSGNLDDELDSLLSETSSLGNPPCTIPHSSKVNGSLSLDNAPASLPSSHPPTSKSKVMEDFDSWLDTI